MSIDISWLQAQFPSVSVLTPLSKGGQKEVFLADTSDLGKVVLKIYHPKSDPQRVLREIQAVQAIQSPRVPNILQSGIKDSPLGELIWIFEEHIGGENLAELLTGQGTLNTTQILKLTVQILEVLEIAENNQIVHRDIKPANIIVDQNGDFWLIDFGIARHLSLESLTDTVSKFGPCTPGYSPPEQFKNSKSEIDTRADLFALGVTLYESWEGINPFIAQNFPDTLSRTEKMPLPELSKSVDSANDFAQFIKSITAKRPGHRPQNAKDALDWIREICDQEGIS